MSPVITVHHLEMSRSTRILWALEELGTPYELEVYKRHRKTFRAGPEIKAIHPVGRFPVVVIDGQAFAESGAILEHLAERFGALAPTDPTARVHYRYWMHFAEGSLMAPLLVGLIMDRLRTGVPFPANAITGAIGKAVNKQYTWPQLADLLSAVNHHLAAHAFFSGDTFSMADIQMSYPGMAAIDRVPNAREAYPALRTWCETMKARPAYIKALEVGGPILPPSRKT